jgi:N-acetylglucosamine-6-phosphate deacetylase
VIDLQVNGAAGHDLTEDPSSLWKVGTALVRFGVRAFVPTLVSPGAATVARAQAVLAAGAPSGYAGAEPLGWHIEGPFISPRRAGAHARTSLALPSLEATTGWSIESGVQIVTIAPELPGALPVIEALAARGVVVSIGHTEATYEQARAAIDAGARYATHLFNAMAPLNHREPGPAAAVLEDARVTIGLIVDGLLVHPALVRFVWRLAGGPSGRVAVVSDAMAALGMPPGRYRLAGREVDVGPDGARVDGVLAGCVVGLEEAVANLARFTGASEAEARTAVTDVPRHLLNLAP